MDLTILLFLKAILIIAVIYAKKNDRAKPLTNNNSEENKSTIKKEHMKDLSKILKRTWRLWTPSKAETRVRKKIKNILDRNNINYYFNSPGDDFHFRFRTKDHLVYEHRLSTASKTNLDFFVVLGIKLDPNAYDRICHLSQMFNDNLNNCILRVNMEIGSLTLHNSESLNHCNLDELLILSNIYEIDNYASDIIWAFNKLLQSNEEAVFIFAEMLNRADKKHMPV